jgi:hypothetical protein
MILDVQEYLQEWEKTNNPFYPKEMHWDRLEINKFLKDYKYQLTTPDVVVTNRMNRVDASLKLKNPCAHAVGCITRI